MSGIIKRTVFYTYDSRPEYRCFRFSDWNQVTTSLGTMMEPSQMVPRPEGGGQVDWMESGMKIDAIQNIESNHQLTGGNDFVTGWNLQPRKGN